MPEQIPRSGNAGHRNRTFSILTDVSSGILKKDTVNIIFIEQGQS